VRYGTSLHNSQAGNLLLFQRRTKGADVSCFRFAVASPRGRTIYPRREDFWQTPGGENRQGSCLVVMAAGRAPHNVGDVLTREGQAPPLQVMRGPCPSEGTAR